ncbi:SRPBCC family protein [Kitasatospora sp. NBC_01287]|uniref:SRPBCC family protein n=1 Tax=Kitasatospora sp. NBC_01287 TaxID=2903573 RepID=UPI002256A6C4|nr:SRPBCC family protein [Kitasatospora sp. NBC_01287]MCX4744120.1 SRPBCC family protein [Kitasatospora sp. NBC_01287]
MSELTESIEVDVPAAVAYQQWSRFEEFPAFISGVERVERVERVDQLDRETPELTHWVVKVGGSVKEFDARVTERTPGERLAWTTVAGELHQSGVVTFHRLGNGRSRIMLQLVHEPHGLVATVGDKLGFPQRQAFDGLRHFKAFVESRSQGR